MTELKDHKNKNISTMTRSSQTSRLNSVVRYSMARAILCKESKYFHKALTGGFEEARSGIIDLGTDEDPHAVRAMLRHIYGLAYIKKEERTNIELQAAIFASADKYDVATLRQLIITRLPKAIMNTINVRDRGFIIALCNVFFVLPADKSMQQLLLGRAKKSIANLMQDKEFLATLDLLPELCLILLKHSYEDVQEVQPIYECTKYGKSYLYLQDPSKVSPAGKTGKKYPESSGKCIGTLYRSSNAKN